MKRNRIYTVGALAVLMLVLSACQVSIDRPRAPVRNFTFESSWRIQGTNMWASCDNLDTYFEYTFYAENPSRIESITEHYVGVRTGEEITALVPRRAWDVQGNTVTVQAFFEADGYFLPLEASNVLEPQAILVRPIPNDPTRENGATNFNIVIEYDGGAGTYRFQPVFVQAYAGCQPIN